MWEELFGESPTPPPPPPLTAWWSRSSPTPPPPPPLTAWWWPGAAGTSFTSTLLLSGVVLLLTLVALRKRNTPDGDEQQGVGSTAAEPSTWRVSAPTPAQQGQPVVVVVGASRGLGLETVKQLAASGGSTLVLTARTGSSGLAALASIPDTLRENVVVYAPLDIREPSHHIAFSSWLKQVFPSRSITAVVLNAGVADKGATEKGVATARLVIETNAVGTTALIKALLPLLTGDNHAPTIADDARFVVVASRRGRRDLVSGAARSSVNAAAADASPDAALALAQRYLELRSRRVDEWQAEGWPPGDAYGVSKLILGAAVEATANTLRQQHPQASLVGVCPGWCRTDMGSMMASRSVEDGAGSIVRLVELPASSIVSGAMYSDGRVVPW
jgi:NAD(P)-dependent dehydrogenase (short-subunit alcohol dehydrogenase family)